eukprot:scaffold1062_cov74-Skeletonema_menzelii.AAC.2
MEETRIEIKSFSAPKIRFLRVHNFNYLRGRFARESIQYLDRILHERYQPVLFIFTEKNGMPGTNRYF